MIQFILSAPQCDAVCISELIAVLFMPQLTEVLKDVKYIQSQHQMEIPAAAAAVFEKRFMFTKVRRQRVSH